MGNITKSAILEYNEMVDTTGTVEDPYKSRVEDVKYGVYTEGGELICKVPNKQEALLTRAELRKIDAEESNKKKKYIIKKL